MRNKLRAGILFSLISLLLFSCEKKSDPPIQLNVIAPAVEKQLAGRLGDRFVKVGKVEFNASEGSVYHVEVFYMEGDQEKRYVMAFVNTADERNLTVFRGEFPLHLIGEAEPGDGASFYVSIDEMMNESKD